MVELSRSSAKHIDKPLLLQRTCKDIRIEVQLVSSQDLHDFMVAPSQHKGFIQQNALIDYMSSAQTRSTMEDPHRSKLCAASERRERVIILSLDESECIDHSGEGSHAKRAVNGTKVLLSRSPFLSKLQRVLHCFVDIGQYL